MTEEKTEYEAKPTESKPKVADSSQPAPIWTKPAWITAIVGLISVFLTVPGVFGEYLAKRQDLELAKVKIMAEQIRNKESQQEIEFKIVHNTLAQQGPERIFLLRFLASTVDDPDTKKWAATEVKRLDDFAETKENLLLAQKTVKEKELKLLQQDVKKKKNIEKEIVMLKAQVNKLQLLSNISNRSAGFPNKNNDGGCITSSSMK